MQILGVLLAAAAGFGMGAIWYMSLAKPWMEAIGKTQEEIDSNQSPVPFIIAGIAAILAAGLMRHMFVMGDITTLGRCFSYGAGIGAFLVAPWVVLHYAFAGRPVKLWMIDGAHVVLAFAAMGLVLGFFI